jgi:pimeloyl-ACP methyl ester carboxylesterase
MSTIVSAAAPAAAFHPFRVALRLLAGVVVAALLLLAAGATYEAVVSAGDATRYPPAGELIDAGGHRLHLNCTGSTTGPTVILDSGLGGSSLDWTLVQAELEKTTAICSYDRAGMGWSEPGPEPRTPSRLAAELNELLTRAHVPGPYVLVGHSLSGKTLRLFAAAHPDLVAGMVLVDARSEVVDRQQSASETAAFAAGLKAQSQQYWWAGRLGLARLIGASLIGEANLTDATATELAVLQTRATAIAATEAEGLRRSADDAALERVSLGNIPLVVIAARDSLANIPHWAEAQKQMLGLSTNSSYVVAESSHAVPIEQPGVVVAAVQEVLAEVDQR